MCVCITAVGTDAMEIYTTYIALNATSPVGIPAEIRQKIEGINVHLYNYVTNDVIV